MAITEVRRSGGSLPARGRGRLAPSVEDRYGAILMCTLAGYAMLGKSVASLGIPPLYISEILLGIGLVIMLRSGCTLAAVASGPGLLLCALLAWALLRTVPFLSVYGLDAARDSVLIGYGLYAFVVGSLLLKRPERLTAVVGFLRGFTGIYVVVGPIVYLFNLMVMVRLPASAADLPLPWLRAGELGVHLSACTVLALLGLRQARPLWIAALLFGITIVATQNRGGFLAIMIPALIALPFSRAWPRVLGFGAIGIVVLGLAYAADLQLPYSKDASDLELPVTVRQATDNVLSLFGSTQNKQLDDTKLFRTMWWDKILRYTIHGEYFWNGKGFGVNLSQDDGFGDVQGTGAVLRSPHNSHMNVLARSGVPGLCLWVVTLMSWLATILVGAWQAWRNGDQPWARLLLFIACYWIAAIIDASFDVALEGPLVGILFWCLMGLGLAVVAIYRAGLSSPSHRRRDGRVVARRPAKAS